MLVALLHSCAGIPDKPVCTRLQIAKGFCVWTASEREQVVDDTHPLITDYGPKTWLDLEMEAVFVPVDSWNEIRGYIIKKCHQYKDCGFGVGDWERRLNSLTPEAQQLSAPHSLEKQMRHSHLPE